MHKLFAPFAGLALVAGLVAGLVAPEAAFAQQNDGVLIGISVPSKIAAIAPEQAGKIVEIPVTDGRRVAVGDVLFRLSSRLEELEVERLRELAESDLSQRRAEAGLKFAEMQAERVRELRKNDISSERDLQAATFEVELAKLKVHQATLDQKQAQNELAKARERLAQRTVKSPFAGTVTQRWKSEGEAVEKFVPVVEVMSLDPLWIEFECPLLDKDMFRVGSAITVAPALEQANTRIGKVSFVSVKAAAASHTFMIRASVDNKDLAWRAGQKMVIARPAAAAPGK